MKKIALIGCGGSIGRQVLNVLKRLDGFEITALVAYSDRSALSRAAEEFGAERCFLASEDPSGALSAAYGDADIVFNAAGGFAGFEYSLAAVRAGKTLALANKETLVCGGDMIMPLAERTGARMIPVDSEHSAIWQCLGFDLSAPFKRLIITASGGAFRGRSYEQLRAVTPAQALSHPTWKMGKKITIDSATLMNKGYEVIEAHHLYSAPYSKIETVIQPQSIVHSLVEFDDGACIAQLGVPSMELPVQLALTFPERAECALPSMDFTRAFSLEFLPLVRTDYPCYDLALSCGERGGLYPCALNAADEEAVNAFLRGGIAFTDIFPVVRDSLAFTPAGAADCEEAVLACDASVRERAREIIERIK